MVAVNAVGAGQQPQTLDTTAEDEQAMADAINSVALSIAMSSVNTISNQMGEMKKTIDDIFADAQE